MSVSESEFLKATSHAARVLFKRFGSIHGSAEDFAQQVVVWSLEALPKYDPSRSLEAYLFTVARTRAMNAIRDRVSRNDPPCAGCHAGTPCRADGSYCPKYARWSARNKAKANLARPLGLCEASDSCEQRMKADSNVESEVEGRELADLIDRCLPVALRADYLRLLAGEQVPKPRRERVRQAVRSILDDPGGCAAETSTVRPDEPDAEDSFDPDDEDE